MGKVLSGGWAILDTPDEIAFAQMAALAGAVKLQAKTGLKMSWGSPYALAKRRYGLHGNVKSVADQMDKMVEEAIAKKHEGPKMTCPVCNHTDRAVKHPCRFELACSCWRQIPCREWEDS